MKNENYTIESLAERVGKEITKANITKWDLYLLDQEIYGLYLRKTEPETHTNGHNLSYYIRVFDDREENKMGVGLVHLNSPNEDLIQNAIRQASSIAKINTIPKYDLIGDDLQYSTPKTFDQPVWDNPNEFLNSMGDKLKVRLNENVGVQTTYGKFRVYKTQKMLVNSSGFRKIKPSTYFYYEFSFKAENEVKKAEYWPNGYLKSVKDLRFEDYISEWATRARDSLRARSPNPDSEIDVIFPVPVVRTAFLGTLGYAASAQSLYEKTSRFKMDEKVASGDFTMWDDGLVEGGLNTSSWDSEGYPKQKTAIIENGVMKNFLFDQKFATLMGGTPTGNAQRKPETGGIMQIEINNLVVKPGDVKLREIVGDSKKAIYINDFSWLNPSRFTGTFGAEIRNAYMIKNGELADPVRGGNLSGNVFEMIKNIEAISQETRVVMNAKVPYIKFKGLNLSAE